MKTDLRHFLNRKGSALLAGLFLCLLSGCDDEPAVILWEPPASGQIIAEGAGEGRPGETYAFRFEGTNIPAGINYVWLFDDGSAEISLSDNSAIDYVFNETGRYFVLLRLLAQDGGYEIARFTFEANIRRDVLVPKMRRIPAGSFTMGADITVPEQPPHTVTLTRAFDIGVYEVTQAEYTSLMGDNPAWYRGAQLPMENVNWLEVIEYCNRLSDRFGLERCYSVDGLDVEFNSSANGYRLPTEAEWEYACRAGTTSEVYSGVVNNPRAGCIDDPALEPAMDRIGWLCFNSDYMTHPVGQKEPNDFDLYDMIGNVAEFVWDRFEGEYYANSPTFNPTGPPTGTERIARGGAHSFGIIISRSASRKTLDPRVNSSFYGFRLARNAN